MRPFWTIVAAIILAAMSNATAIAQNGVWTRNGTGTNNWGTASNWQSNQIADGAGFTATFESTAATTITLDSSRTIGSLIFAGTNTSGYTLRSTNGTINLTLSGSPVITTTQNATISLALLGNEGFRKLGLGSLTLSGTNSLAGTLSLEEGTLLAVDGVGLSASAALWLQGNFQGDSAFVSNTTSAFTRSLGFGAGQIGWTGSGDVRIQGNFNFGGAATPSTITWGQSGFVLNGFALKLNANLNPAILATTTISNPINFAGGSQTIDVGYGEAFLTGGISNGFMFTKTGVGLLTIRGASIQQQVFINDGNLALVSASSTGIMNIASGTSLILGQADLNAADRMLFSGTISGAGNLRIGSTVTTPWGSPQPRTVATAGGAVRLIGTNNYFGTTTITDGYRLQAADGVSLPNSTMLELTGYGLYEAGRDDVLPETFIRPVGAFAGQVMWTGSGGFAARGKLTVNLGGIGQALTWGFGGFVPSGSSLVFDAGTWKSDTQVNELRFENQLNLDGAIRRIEVLGDYNYAKNYTEITGQITNGGVVITTQGMLKLTPPQSGPNLFTLGLQIEKGYVFALDSIGLPFDSNLQLGGNATDYGVFASTGSFIRVLGTAANQVSWLTNGGFAAYGADMTVNIGGFVTPQTLTWGSTNFVPTGRELVLGSIGSGVVRLDFQNGLDLGGATRTVRVSNSSVAFWDQPGDDVVRISGQISNGTLNKTGKGTLELTATNPGTLTRVIVADGSIIASEAIGLPSATALRLAGTGSGYTKTAGMYLGSGTFIRVPGTGAGQVEFAGGGFTAYGATLSVNLGNDLRNWTPANNTLITFNAQSIGTNRVSFLNPVVLTSGFTLSIDVGDTPGTDTDDVFFSNTISAGTTTTLTKLGIGRLVLNANFQTSTRIDAGTLRAAALGGNASIRGGVWETSGIINRPLGNTLTTQIQLPNLSTAEEAAGFAAFGAALNLNFGGTGLATIGPAITWGTTTFNPQAGLAFGSQAATDLTTLLNDLNLNGVERQIYVADNPSSSADAALISGRVYNGDLLKTGSGTLTLSGANSDLNLVTVQAGRLVYQSDAAGTIDGAVVEAGATLVVAAGTGGVTGNYPDTVDVYGTFVNNAVVPNGTILVHDGGTLQGTGSALDAYLYPGSTLSPGNSIGAATFTTLTLDSSTTDPTVVVFEFWRPEGNAPGTDWDLLTIGTLSLLATSSSPVTIRVDSWVSATGGHGANTFNVNGEYSWLWMDVGTLDFAPGEGSIPSRFRIADSEPNAGVFGTGNPYIKPLGYGFYVSVKSGDLYLNYGAVPEPSSGILIAVAGTAGWFAKRRRRKRAAMISRTTDSSCRS
jgi:fibronectin-binding autotransporter adhesin